MAQLSKLEWLYVEGVTKDTHLESYGTLTNLVGLGIIGNESKPLMVPSLSPLAKLANLR